MVLDADVVVESLTDGTLSESIRNVFSGRDEQRQVPAGLARLPAKRLPKRP